MNLLLDGLTILIIVVFAAASYKKGFFNAVVRLAGMIASLAVAVMVSGPAAGYIYDSFLSEAVGSAVDKHIGEISAAGAGSFAEGMSGLIEELPGLVSGVMRSGLGQRAGEWYELVEQSRAEGMTEAVIHGIIETAAVGVIRVILFFILFALLMLAVNIIAGLMLGVNALPVIGPLNALLGGLLGAAQGMLCVFAAAAAVWLALSASGGEIGPLSAGAIEESFIFREFYNLGPWA